MTEYSIDGEAAISAVTSGAEFHVYDADSTKRTKKCSAAQIAAFMANTPAANAASVPMIDAESYVVLAADYVLTDTSAVQKVTNGSTNGAITLASGQAYLFEANYNITNTGTTAHTWATAFGGTATFATGTSYQAYGNFTTTAGVPATGGLSGFLASATLSTAVVCTASNTSSTEQVSIELSGVIVTGATGGGTLIPQVKLSAATGGTETVKAGSFFRIWAINGTGVVGAWS